MDESIKFTIIIPVFNTQKYLYQCIESVVNQKYKNLEIIIINDGSTDGSEMVINSFLEKYPNITYVKQNNHGLAYTRNKGIGLATGDYIYFMDSDDYISLDLFYDLAQVINDNKYEAILFDAKSFFDTEFKNKKTNLTNYSRHNYGDYRRGIELFSAQMKNNEFYSSACLYVVRRDVFEKNNLKFIEGILHEDELFTVKLIISLGKVIHINKPYFKRRIRSGSIMTSGKLRGKFEGYFITLKELIEIYTNFNFMNKFDRLMFKKKIKDIYRQLIKLIHSDDTVITHNESKELKKIEKQFHYFGVSGFLFAYLKPVYDFLNKLQKR